MKKIYLIGLIVGAIGFSSCDDFLTETPKHKQTIENVITDYTSAQYVVNGIYSTYTNCSYLGGYLYTSLATQASLWIYSNSAFKNMTYYQGNTSDYTTPYIWKQLYGCVNSANTAISGIEGANPSIFPSEQAKISLLAEARCFRGFANLNLLWFFGHWFADADSPYGLVYRDQQPNLTNLMAERISVGESYQYIIDDLEYAEKYLGDYTSPRLMSKQFAQVMHAKLLLVRGWDGDYTKALELVNTVMTKAPSIFKMESNISDLYDKSWDSNELLFCRYLGDQTMPANNDYPYSAGLFDKKTFEEIPTGWLEADPRFEYIVGEAYGPNQWQVDQGVKGIVLTKLYRGGRGKDPYGKYTTYVFRYAELYLMKAELLARTNPSDIAGALKPLNDMRAQYVTPHLDPVPMPANHQELMDAIFKEYIVTLFLENETEWFASIRFKTADGETWLKKLKGSEINYTENQYCWPIPDDEMKTHDNEILQNPGLSAIE